MVIESDVSEIGWGVYCEGVIFGGLWFTDEVGLYINCLELFGVILAIKFFVRGRSNIVIFLRTDNTIVLSYINRFGGIVFLELVILAK